MAPRKPVDPVTLAARNRRRRELYEQQKSVRDFKKSKMTKNEITKLRDTWRKRKQSQRLKHKIEVTSTPIKRKIPGQVRSGLARRKANRIHLLCHSNALEYRLRALETKVEKYRKRWHRLKTAIAETSISPRTKCRKEFKREKLSSKVKTRLEFAAALETDLQTSYKKLESKTEKKRFCEFLTFKFLAKYHFMSLAKPFFPWNARCQKKFGVKNRKFKIVRECVEKFYEQDDVSTQAPGKKDFIVRKKIQKQKRYLCNSLKFLHQKFCAENPFVISYALFCRLRPFWVITKRLSERDTCLCIKHENINLVCQRLRLLKVIPNVDLDELIEDEMCCPKVTNRCLFRECQLCIQRTIPFLEYDGFITSYYDVWEITDEMGKDNKSYKRMTKKRKPCQLHEMVTYFMDLLPAYMSHICKMKHQYAVTKKLKNNLGDKDAVLQIDFSENYACKSHREIQACHFGGNRLQITLHTGVMYIGDNKPMSFATSSKDLRHDPVAILAHLEPVFENYLPTDLQNLHFISDSPPSQYRNTAMMAIMKTEIIPKFPQLQTFSWNYSESGHGKSAADGVGAVIKRTCDRVIADGSADILNFQDFNRCVADHLKKVVLLPITTERDDDLYQQLRQRKPVAGE